MFSDNFQSFHATQINVNVIPFCTQITCSMQHKLKLEEHLTEVHYSRWPFDHLTI